MTPLQAYRTAAGGVVCVVTGSAILMFCVFLHSITVVPVSIAAGLQVGGMIQLGRALRSRKQ